MSSINTPPLAAANLFAVEGLVAVITGGATGIGLMMAKALAQNGAKKVYIVGRRKEVLEQAAKEHSVNGNIVPLQGDATNNADLARLVDQVTADSGYIDLFIANAGIIGPVLPTETFHKGNNDFTALQKELWNTDPADFDYTFNVNVRSVYYSIVAFLPLLAAGNAQPGGHAGDALIPSSHVVIISSMTGSSRQLSPHFPYSASKAAVTHLGKLMATAFLPHRIRVNVVAPGLFPSEITDSRIAELKETVSADVYSSVMESLGRLGNEHDMGGLILLLASKAGGWMSGNVILNDGGKLSLQPAVY